jgi:dienelactone hydrolase
MKKTKYIYIMQNIKSTLTILLLSLWSFTTNAQEKYLFKEGLAVGGVHQYGREALYSDALAYQLYSGSLKPKAGAEFSYSNGTKKAIWTAVQSDSSGGFRSGSLGSGYLYLTYNAAQAQTAILVATGHSMLYVNGTPHAGDMYRYGWMNIPVALKKGLNEIYIRSAGMGRYARINVRMEFPSKQVSIVKSDPTLPFLVKEESKGELVAGIVVLNSSIKNTASLTIKAGINGKTVTSNLPVIPSLISRKVAVKIPVPDNIQKGNYDLSLSLYDGNKLIDTATLSVSAVNKGEHATYTFISNIDGSVQYYAVAPQTTPTANPALFLSVHGAEVEAISQARAYKPKAEGPVVAPTNRRPRGFNWEDWGRLDALEVLDIAKKRFSPDPQKVYLTGHSMGGHGTWYLGATFAGNWAAIAPSAGYPTLAEYGSHDGKVPTDAATDTKKILIRASNTGNVISLAKNYKAGGVYIFHGDADSVVSVEYARQMKRLLAEFHPDFCYKEYPGGSHWFSDESVDWPPLFEYFKQHKIPTSKEVNEINFTTASVGISSTHHWVKLLQQNQHFQFSKVELKRDLKLKAIKGNTTNLNIVQFNLSDFNNGDTVLVNLDGQIIKEIVAVNSPLILKKKDNQWMKSELAPGYEKGEKRNGGFKEAFKNNMVFVYGTKGTKEENEWMLNKAKYDAETWYYRGNGAIDIVADDEFDAVKYAGRGVILFGNITTNTAAAILLKDCPVKVSKGIATVGNNTFSGDDLGSYYMWPNSQTDFSSIALIGGTGLKGMRAAEANQYFAGGSGFPDFMIFSLNMLEVGESAVKAAGYFNNQWQLDRDIAINR